MVTKADSVCPIVSDAPSTLWEWDLWEEMSVVLTADKAFYEDIMLHNITDQSGQQSCYPHYRGLIPISKGH